MTLAFEHPGFAPRLVDYRAGLDLQRAVHAGVVAGTVPNTVLLLEHPPVYTAGRMTRPEDHPWDGTEVVPVGRGGRLTYHGPGMLIGYPILALPVPLDVVRYVRALERVLVDVAAEFDVEATTVEGRSGTWVAADARGPARKLAAIGVQVSRRVTLHGFSLNCNPDLRPFGRIVPCGITDAGVTSLAAETGRDLSPADVAPVVERILIAHEADLCAPPRGAAPTPPPARSEEISA